MVSKWSLEWRYCPYWPWINLKTVSIDILPFSYIFTSLLSLNKLYTFFPGSILDEISWIRANYVWHIYGIIFIKISICFNILIVLIWNSSKMIEDLHIVIVLLWYLQFICLFSSSRIPNVRMILIIWIILGTMKIVAKLSFCRTFYIKCGLLELKNLFSKWFDFILCGKLMLKFIFFYEISSIDFKLTHLIFTK